MWCMGSVVEVWRGLSCHTACLWTRIELMSPALAGGFLTTGPPGNSKNDLITGSGVAPFPVGVIRFHYPCLFKTPRPCMDKFLEALKTWRI